MSSATPADILARRRHLLLSDLAQKPLGRLEPSDLRRLYAAKLSSGLSSTPCLIGCSM